MASESTEIEEQLHILTDKLEHLTSVFQKSQLDNKNPSDAMVKTCFPCHKNRALFQPVLLHPTQGQEVRTFQ